MEKNRDKNREKVEKVIEFIGTIKIKQKAKKYT